MGLHISLFEAFISFVGIAVVFYISGYFNAWINHTKGFSKEETAKIEALATKAIGEVTYDAVDGISQDGVQFGPSVAPHRNSQQ